MFNESLTVNSFHDKCMSLRQILKTDKGDFTVGYFITHGIVPYMDCYWCGSDNILRSCIIVGNNWNPSMGVSLDIGRYCNLTLRSMITKLGVQSPAHTVCAIANYNMFDAGERSNIVWFDWKTKKIFIAPYRVRNKIDPEEIRNIVDGGKEPNAVFTKTDVLRFYKNLKR